MSFTRKLSDVDRTRRIFMDMLEGDKDVPKRGDYIETLTKRAAHGTYYKILEARRVKRRDPAALPRFTMITRIVSRLPKPAPKLFFLQWYSREKAARNKAISATEFYDRLSRAILKEGK